MRDKHVKKIYSWIWISSNKIKMCKKKIQEGNKISICIVLARKKEQSH